MIHIHEKSKYAIVRGKDCSLSERKGAEELRALIAQATGIILPILTDEAKERAEEIVVGNTNRKGIEVDFASLGDDGFVLKTVGKKLFIVGGAKRGTLYGVYSFCEDILGYRWFTSDTTVIPKLKEIFVPCLNETQIPCFTMREAMWKCGFEPTWAIKQKINRGHWINFPREYGGGIVYAGWMCHTLGELAETGYDAPEPCLTDPKIYQTVLKNCKQRLTDRPDADIMPVSQNDDFRYCRCENCKRVDEEEGSHAGTMIRFVNAIAKELEKDFPKVKVKTLAYQYTRKPPKTKPRDNVIVELCSIECCRSHALNECDTPAPAPWAELEEGESFQRDLARWGQVTKELHIWDYTTNYHHYFAPFPNLENLRKNLRYFAESGVKGMLEQGNMNAPVSGEFGELKCYLIAKLLWNPYMDDDTWARHKKEFMQAYYGAGYEYLERYINELSNAVGERHIGIYYHPLRILPKDEGIPFMRQAKKWFAEAKKRALTRVQKLHIARAELQVRYYLQIATYETEYEQGTDRQKRAYVARNEKLFAFILKHGIFMNPDITIPENPDYTKSPDIWHKLG